MADEVGGEPGVDQPAREGAPRGPDAAGEEFGDEPLPTAYGMRPTARPGDAPRPEGARGDRPAEPREGTEAGSEGRGRRRRRRGEGRSRGERDASSRSREPGQGRQRGRGGQRRPSGETRSSTFSRGRRDDFAPVSDRHDEDDEGLEFLGVEEAGQDQSRRRAAEDEDILVESGLNTVLDVPSWVEAIGIVIAGNLDARNKSGREGGRGR